MEMPSDPRILRAVEYSRWSAGTDLLTMGGVDDK